MEPSVGTAIRLSEVMSHDVHDIGISIRLLGVPEAVLPPHCTSFPSRGYCLLALLALAPGRTLSRAAAADRIWHSAASAASLANMRQLVKRMQASMPTLNDMLGIDSRSIWLTEGCEQIDLCRFLEINSITSREDFEQAAQLYRGDLLESVELSKSPMEETIPTLRAQLRDRYFSLVHEGLAEATRYGHADPGFIRAVEQHALSIEPDREETCHALIRAYGAIGNGKEARRVYEALEARLRDESLPAPLDSTRAALARAESNIVQNLWTPASERREAAGAPRVALLAPMWVAADDAQENIVRAFVEDLANELARDSSFVTVAAHSSFQARHDGGLLLDNSKLRADFTLSSTMQPDGGMGEMSARLVDNRSGSIVWADRLPLVDRSLFTVRRQLVDRVANEVTSAVEAVTLAQHDQATEGSAYLHFLLGQRALKTTSLRSIRQAKRHFSEAIRRDRSYAEPYAGLSSALYTEWILLGGNEPRFLAESRELAESAIRQRPHSSAGHWRKAMVALYQHDFDTSEACFKIAHDLHPNAADILLDHSDALGFIGDPDHAWSTFNRALDLNPMPPEHYWWVGAGIAFSKSDFAGAVQLCERLEDDEPVLRLLAASHGQLGNRSEAREYGRRLRETYPGQDAVSLTLHQPHRDRSDLQPFIDGLRIAGIH